MKRILVLSFLTMFSSEVLAVCASPISRTNNTTNQILTSTKYNLDINTVYTKVNNLPGDCITDATITTDKIANEAVTAEKIAAVVLAKFTPVGTILAFGGTSAPTGFLICNGQQVSRTTYADLFAIIGTSFGAGNGSTTFHVPDFRGRFLRGVDTGIARDPGRGNRTAMNIGGLAGDNIGSVQGYATARPTANAFITDTSSHNHGIPTFDSGEPNAAYVSGLTTGNRGYSSLKTDSKAHEHIITLGGDDETRPINAGVNFIIKY